MKVSDQRLTLTPPQLIGVKSGQVTRNVTDHLRKEITSSWIKPGDRLPAARGLAQDWGIARGTLVTAIDILCAEELLIARRGAGVFVSETAHRQPVENFKVSGEAVVEDLLLPQPKVDSIETGKIDFRPCRPSVAEFPLAEWRRCVSDASVRTASPDYSNAQGIIELREALTDYLRRSRGLSAGLDQMFISTGIVHAIHLLSRLYLRPGAKVIMEEPGYPLARQIFEAAGAKIVPCPVDSDGLIVDALPLRAHSVTFVYVTPSHQFPYGSRLSAARRAALIEWAMRNKVLVLEDDYDGEFRYDVPPLPPLAAIPNKCVIYLGTFSKTLFPDVRVGYVVAPTPIIEALTRYRTMHEYGLGTITQHALSDYIAQGYFEKHIHKMGRVYKTKRAHVQVSLTEFGIPGALSGLESGLHSVLKLEDGLDADTVSRRLEEIGVLIPPIGKYLSYSPAQCDSLVFGYAEPSLDKISKGMKLLGEIIAESL